MSLEVKPGMFSLAEAKVSWKAPWAMAVFSVLVFVAPPTPGAAGTCGIHGNRG